MLARSLPVKCWPQRLNSQTSICLTFNCSMIYLLRHSPMLCLACSLITLLSGCAPVQTMAHEVSASATARLAPTSIPTPSAIPTPRASATATPSATPEPPTATPEPPTATPPPSPTLIADTQREQLFDEVWKIIDEHYLYPDFHGQNWQSIHDAFAPRIAIAGSNDAFYGLLTEMVSQLNDNHSRFLAPIAANVEDAMSTGREAYVGIGVLLVSRPEGALVQEVFPKGPADQAGIRPRDRIVAIDGAPFDAGGDLFGPDGSQVRLTVVRPGAETRDVVLSRRAVQGRIVPVSRRLDNDIGYLKIPTLWVNDMDAQVSGALTDMIAERPITGLVLDLRGNPGGWNYVLTGILGHFVRGRVGTFFDQKQTKPLTIAENAGPDLRGTPLAVLVDDSTASYAEVMAGVLQLEVNAQIVGVPTAGNTETIYAYELVGGARLWVAQEGFRLMNGQNLESHGVQPNAVIDVDWTQFSEDADPQINEAVRLLSVETLRR